MILKKREKKLKVKYKKKKTKHIIKDPNGWGKTMKRDRDRLTYSYVTGTYRKK